MVGIFRGRLLYLWIVYGGGSCHTWGQHHTAHTMPFTMLHLPWISSLISSYSVHKSQPLSVNKVFYTSTCLPLVFKVHIIHKLTIIALNCNKKTSLFLALILGLWDIDSYNMLYSIISFSLLIVTVYIWQYDRLM